MNFQLWQIKLKNESNVMNNELREYRTNQICDLWPKLSYSDKIIIKHTIDVGPNTKTLKV